MLNVANKPITLSVLMLNVIMLNVAATFSITTLSLKTLCMTTFSTMTLSIIAFNIMTLSIATLSATVVIYALSNMSSVTNKPFILSVTTLNVVMRSVAAPCSIMLSIKKFEFKNKC